MSNRVLHDAEQQALDLDGLQELLWGFAGQRVVTVAGRTGLLRRLAAGPASPEQAASELGLDPLAVGKVMRALCALGLIEPEDDGYRMVATLKPFFEAGDQDLSAFLEHSHQLYDRWGESLEPWVRGQSWPTQRRSPADLLAFGRAMQAMGEEVGRRLAQAVDLTGARRLLDVGGGFGHYARALCAAVPGLSAVVLDQPEVVALAPKEVEGREAADRLVFVGGDYLEAPFGEGFDAVLLANVLHQERPERASALVRRAASALVPGGQVLIVDFAIDDEQQVSPMGALFAVNMRSFGDTYPEPTLRRWMEQAGLVDVWRMDLGRSRWLLQGTKPK